MFQWLSIIDHIKLKSLREMSFTCSLHRTLTKYYYVFNTVSDVSKTERLLNKVLFESATSMTKIMKKISEFSGYITAS